MLVLAECNIPPWPRLVLPGGGTALWPRLVLAECNTYSPIAQPGHNWGWDSLPPDSPGWL